MVSLKIKYAAYIAERMGWEIVSFTNNSLNVAGKKNVNLLEKYLMGIDGISFRIISNGSSYNIIIKC